MWWSKKFADVRFLWTRRNGNKVADKLAKQPITQNELSVITFYVPPFVTMDLHHDFVVSQQN